MADYKFIKVAEDDGIFTVTFNRPDKRNAMNPGLHLEMHKLLTELRFDPKVRVLIITGAGESFSAGQDLKEYFFELSESDARLERERIRAISNEWRNHLLRLFHAPTIAMVNGWCFGGAFSIVCACDIAIAAEEATFGLSEINFKHFPGGMVTKNITETLRPREALYYSMTGESFSGKRAHEIGLVTKAVPKAELAETVQTLAKSLRLKDPIALRMCKEVYKINMQMNYEEAYAYASAKSDQATLLQQGGWLKGDGGIGGFLKGNYKPGLETAETAKG
jgi:trans-feruloyl-CoA hydratase/vanillin synthase